MTEADIRRIAREEAQKVLREYLEDRRRRRLQRMAAEERNHEEAMEAAFGPHGQG